MEHKGCPVGSWGNSFNNYLGIPVRRSDIWNIYYDWKSQPWSLFSATWRDLQVYDLTYLNKY